MRQSRSLLLSSALQILERGCALLGYAPIGNTGMLLLATRLRSAAVLPGGHTIRLVAESRWLQISLLVSGFAAEDLVCSELLCSCLLLSSTKSVRLLEKRGFTAHSLACPACFLKQG